MISLSIEVDGRLFKLEGQDDPIDLNQSRITLYNACHRKFYWQYVENLVPDRPMYHFHVGTAVHTALAMVHTGSSVEDATKAAASQFMSLLPKKPDGSPRIIPGDEEIVQENLDIVRNLVPAYVEEYKGEPDPWHPMGIEVAGRVEVGEKGSGIFLVFRTDQIVSWNNQLWIIDHKTTKKMDLRDLMKYEMDFQFSAYVYGVTCLMQKYIAGIIVNVLVKTKIPQFARQCFTRTVDELKEFEAEFLEIGNEIRGRLARVKNGEDPKIVFYRNTSQCFNMGTCWYRDLCLKDTPNRRLQFIARKEDYVDEHHRKRLAAAPDAGESTHQPGSSE